MLVRPDHYVAWRGAAQPEVDYATILIDTVRGASTVETLTQSAVSTTV